MFIVSVREERHFKCFKWIYEKRIKVDIFLAFSSVFCDWFLKCVSGKNPILIYRMGGKRRLRVAPSPDNSRKTVYREGRWGTRKGKKGGIFLSYSKGILFVLHSYWSYLSLCCQFRIKKRISTFARFGAEWPVFFILVGKTDRPRKHAMYQWHPFCYFVALFCIAWQKLLGNLGE